MIKVSCAIIKNDEGKILVAQRSPAMRLPNKWEFPGGKLEPGETEEESLVREIKEELDIDIQIIRSLPTYNHFDLSAPSILFIPFECRHISGDIVLLEHAAYKWLSLDELSAIDWAEADIHILKDYLREAI